MELLSPVTRRTRSVPPPRAARHGVPVSPVVQVGHLEHVLVIPSAIVRGFAEAVAHSLVAGVLPYADRQRLLRRAARLGIGRFDANLIIASVQHRRPDQLAVHVGPKLRPATSGLLNCVALVLLVEAIVVAVATWYWLA